MSIVKGKRAVSEAILHPTQVERIFVPFGAKDPDLRQIQQAARKAKIKVQELNRHEFESRYGKDTQHIVALVAEVEFFPFSKVDPDEYPAVLVMDHLHDPHNFGAILRTAECLGVEVVVYAKDRQAQLTPTVVQVSSGAARHLKLVRVSNIAQSVKELKKRGYLIIGADEKSQVSVTDYRPNGPAALVLGNEGEGISRLVRDSIDQSVSIPMAGNVGSLNVSVAAGILIWTLFA